MSCDSILDVFVWLQMLILIFLFELDEGFAANGE